MGFIAEILYKLSDDETKVFIDADMKRFLKWNSMKNEKLGKRLRYLIKENMAFRNVFYYRIKRGNGKFIRLSCKLCEKYYKPINTIELGGDIGPGCLISHNFSIIYPQKTGENFRVGPGVVVGRNKEGFPVIGNNVYIAANSTVIGNIKIGDNVIIGAGTVVTKSVPDNVVVVGNPARVIREIKEEDFNEIM